MITKSLVEKFLSPSSITVIGVSRNTKKIWKCHIPLIKKRKVTIYFLSILSRKD